MSAGLPISPLRLVLSSTAIGAGAAVLCSAAEPAAQAWAISHPPPQPPLPGLDMTPQLEAHGWLASGAPSALEPRWEKRRGAGTSQPWAWHLPLLATPWGPWCPSPLQASPPPSPPRASAAVATDLPPQGPGGGPLLVTQPYMVQPGEGVLGGGVASSRDGKWWGAWACDTCQNTRGVPDDERQLDTSLMTLRRLAARADTA